jgi:heme exporter protein D
MIVNLGPHADFIVAAYAAAAIVIAALIAWVLRDYRQRAAATSFDDMPT